MGWASGTYVAQAIEDIILKYVSKESQLKAAEEVSHSLYDQDWDCTDEVDIFNYLYLLGRKKDNFDGDDKEEQEMMIEEMATLKEKLGLN